MRVVVVCAAIIIRPIGPFLFLFRSGYTNQSKWSQSVSISQKGKTVPSVSLGWYPPRKKTRPSFFLTNVPSVFIHFYIYSSFTGFFTCNLPKVSSIISFGFSKRQRRWWAQFRHPSFASSYISFWNDARFYLCVSVSYIPAGVKKKPRYSRCTTRRVDWLDLFRWCVPSPRDI